jgi:riboflavin kinase/FMN adenylyltransferase
MKTINGSIHFKKTKRPVVLTIGNFDGVHIGHQKIFKNISQTAKKLKGLSVVYTFFPHPVKIIAPSACPKMLQTQEQKLETIEKHSIDICVVEPFTASFSRLSPKNFFNGVLLKRFSPSKIVVGYDLTFGRHRTGTIELLKKLCGEKKITFELINAVFSGETLVSSTRIRKLIAEGNVELARKMLGHPYSMSGMVVKGRGIGGILGFHTANLEVENELIPSDGVYLTKTLGHLSVTNIGPNPTFHGDKTTIETHILNYSGNLVSKKIEIIFYKRLRDEIEFKGPIELKKQIKKDIKRAKLYGKNI